MSLEHTLLDRLEKRSLQIVQQKNEIYGLRQLVDEKNAINEQLAEQITTARLEREQMQHQIAELRTECDRIREIAKSLVPKSALKQAVQEAAELHAEVSKLVEENKKLVAQTEDSEVAERRERLIKSLNDEITKRDHELRAHEKELAEQREEIRKLRAEVPLESTREGLKNATAKIAELKNDVRRCYELADEIGRGDGESIVDLITRQAGRITGLIAKLQEVTTDRDRVLNELAAIVAEANKSGRCGGDPVALLKQGQVDRDTAESLDRQLGAALAVSNERAQEIRKLMDGHAEDMKAQAELTARLDSAKGESEEWLMQCHAARRQRDEIAAEVRKETHIVYQIADKLGRNQAESIPEFMERQALRLAALESKAGPSIETLSAELSVRYAEIAELHKWATGLIESPAFAHYHYERVQEYNEIVARINSRPQLDLTVTLPTVDWQVVARNLEQTIAGLNAKVAELEAQGAYATKVASQLGERIAYVQKQSMALETLVMRIKSYRNTEAVQQCALIHQLIDATLETMGTRLTA